MTAKTRKPTTIVLTLRQRKDYPTVTREAIAKRAQQLTVARRQTSGPLNNVSSNEYILMLIAEDLKRSNLRRS